MVTTNAPLLEKIALLWHRVFATGQTKLIQGKVIVTQIDMFRRLGLGNYRDLLLALSHDPAMLMWPSRASSSTSAIFSRSWLKARPWEASLRSST